MKEFKIATASEIPPGQRKRVSIDGKDVLVLNVSGKFYAIGNKCPHRGCSMFRGKLRDKVIVCPCHSAQFDLETGAVVARHSITGPLPTYQVKIEGGDVLVADCSNPAVNG
ncbi:MAG: Rieske (2Fe-2S) protein [Chloroflexi bacterium]|nr:Rieske (2Fe-2S) protein [Chloroflexota bacterium]